VYGFDDGKRSIRDFGDFVKMGWGTPRPPSSLELHCPAMPFVAPGPDLLDLVVSS